ncbi:nitrile hydratase subunit alpha [Microbispora sp. H13382]|uniref:nitrile hydratase subunit alpha n=1 Tax=Microbispora sp. H13382 TaxID=2729112 RepID=UPI0037C7CD1C
MSTHSHDPHAPVQEPEEINEFEILELAVRELAIEKGVFSAEDHRRFSEWAESRTPMYGSRLVAKAWLDPAFKERLLADGTETSKEVGWTGSIRPGRARRATTPTSTCWRTPRRCTT